MRAHALYLFVLLACGTSLPMTAAHRPAVARESRLREIALTYTEAYETARRFEEYSSQNRDLTADVLSDAEYYDRVFDSTKLDARGTMVIEPVEDVELRGTALYRVYASTVNPPHPVYVLGVRKNGTIFRFQGFNSTDFDEFVRDEDARADAGLRRVVQLYYRLLTSFRPGPLLDQRALDSASSAIMKVDIQTRNRSGEKAELFLPQITPGSDSTLLRLCVFDEVSTRLELHHVRVTYDGQIEILDKTIVRDIYLTSY